MIFMKISRKELKEMIYECACEAMRDMGMDGPLSPMDGGMKVIKVKALPAPDQMRSELFPSLGGHHVDDHLDAGDDQDEKGMIIGNLNRMAERASELAQMASAVPDNEEWVQEKIAVASAMIDSIYNYMKYRDEE